MPLPPGVLTDGVVVAYALWTLAANLAVMTGGNARTLSLLGVAVVGGMLVLGALVYRRVPWAGVYLADAAPDSVCAAQVPDLASAARGLFMPVVTLLLWLSTGNAWVAWGGLLLTTLLLYTRALKPAAAVQSVPTPPVPDSRVERAALYALAFGCALFTLLAVRPRSDDALYLNLAVSIVDAPHEALLSVLHLHGPPSTTLGLQRVFPPYRVHSFELLGGLVSRMTGFEPAAVVHFGLATLLGWFTPFALARLLRMLAPRHWLVALLVMVSFYCIEGSASRGFANHALVRFFNGKAALLTLGVPLVCAYGLRYGARPSRWRLGMLGLSQVAAVGLSSTGIWLVPVLAVVSVAAATPTRRLLPARLGASVLSSTYVLALAVWILAQMNTGLVEPTEVDALSATVSSLAHSGVPTKLTALADGLPIVLGPERTVIALLGAMLVAALVSPGVLGLRLLSGLALLVAAAFGNPLLAEWVARHVTGVTTYQRIFWLLPVPLAVGLSFAWLFGVLRERLPTLAASALTLLALGGFYGIAVDRLVISEANAAKLHFPPVLKLPPHARLVAKAVCKLAPKDKCVLASAGVSQQLPIIPGCGYPLIAADRWLSASLAEVHNRTSLVKLVDEPGDITPDRASWFLDALETYGIDAIVLTKDANDSARTKSLVRMADFEHVAIVDWEHVFVRTRSERYEEHRRVVTRLCDLGGPEVAVLAPFGVSNLLDERGCAQAVASVRAYRGAFGEAAEGLLKLERYTYLTGDLLASADTWMRQALDAHAISIVVLAPPAMVNRRFRVLLAQAGFRKIAFVNGYSILRRPLPAPKL